MAQGSRKRPVPKLLAKKLRLVRMRLGVGQAEMARLLSKTSAPPDGGMISRFERGEREPNLFVILQYGRLAKINPTLLFDDSWTVKEVDASIPTDVRKK
jgi:transcriptional regulator with XRE-family HTH domain